MSFSGEIGIPVGVNRFCGQSVVMWDVLRGTGRQVAQRCLDGDVSGATSLAVLADNEASFQEVREDGRWLF